MDISRMSDEELAIEIRGRCRTNMAADDLVKFIRQCVKDSAPKGLTVEEIAKILLQWDSIIADSGLAMDGEGEMKKFILNGHDPVVEPDLIKWAEWFGTADRQVAKTEIGDVKISTVFLGLDHSFCGGVPVLFETMVFGGDLDGELDRYQTWDDAVEGHNRMVERAGK